MVRYECGKREINNRKAVKHDNDVVKRNKTNIEERETRGVDFYIHEYERGGRYKTNKMNKYKDDYSNNNCGV